MKLIIFNPEAVSFPSFQTISAKVISEGGFTLYSVISYPPPRIEHTQRKVIKSLTKKFKGLPIFLAFSHVQMGSAFVVGLSISFRVIALRPTGFG
jgi:hypothetical protein